MTRLLLVDDDSVNLFLLESMLGGCGYEFERAMNGAEAWRMAHATSPDLILLDVMMPDVDGFELCRRLRFSERLREVPIILVTALDDRESRLKGIEAGADEFLSKPLNRDEIRLRVRNAARLNRFRAIAQQRERFQNLFDLSPSGILFVEHRGRVTMGNPRALALLDDCQKGVVGMRLEDLFPAEVIDALHGMMASDDPPAEEAKSVSCRRRGGQQYLSIRSSRLPAESRPMSLLAIEDVSSLTLARLALEEANRSLEARVAQRTEQLDQANQVLLSYANFVAHDLRSPLTVLSGFLGLVRETSKGIDEDAAEMLNLCFDAASTMDQQIDTMLQLARDERAATPITEPTDPNKVLNRVVMHARRLRPKLKVEFRIDELPPVMARAPLVERVLYGLVATAVKNLPEDVSDPVIEIGARLGDTKHPVIFMRDGAATGDVDTCQQWLSTNPSVGGESAAPGAGLGLSLISRLLHAHHGRIWVEAPTGGGLTYFVQFGGVDIGVALGAVSVSELVDA